MKKGERWTGRREAHKIEKRDMMRVNIQQTEQDPTKLNTTIRDAEHARMHDRNIATSQGGLERHNLGDREERGSINESQKRSPKTPNGEIANAFSHHDDRMRETGDPVAEEALLGGDRCMETKKTGGLQKGHVFFISDVAHKWTKILFSPRTVKLFVP